MKNKFNTNIVYLETQLKSNLNNFSIIINRHALVKYFNSKICQITYTHNIILRYLIMNNNNNNNQYKQISCNQCD